jgi:hypothetical protein
MLKIHTHTHTHMYIYIYILLALCQNPLNVEFLGSFHIFSELPRQFAPDMSGLWPGHIRLLARTCPGLRFPSYIKGPHTPWNPSHLFPSHLEIVRWLGSPKSFWGPLHRNPSISSGFGSPSLQNLHNPKRFSLS